MGLLRDVRLPELRLLSGLRAARNAHLLALRPLRYARDHNLHVVRRLRPRRDLALLGLHQLVLDDPAAPDGPAPRVERLACVFASTTSSSVSPCVRGAVCVLSTGQTSTIVERCGASKRE